MLDFVILWHLYYIVRDIKLIKIYMKIKIIKYNIKLVSIQYNKLN